MTLQERTERKWKEYMEVMIKAKIMFGQKPPPKVKSQVETLKREFEELKTQWTKEKDNEQTIVPDQ